MYCRIKKNTRTLKLWRGVTTVTRMCPAGQMEMYFTPNTAIKGLKCCLYSTSHQTQGVEETSCLCKVRFFIINKKLILIQITQFDPCVFKLCFYFLNPAESKSIMKVFVVLALAVFSGEWIPEKQTWIHINECLLGSDNLCAKPAVLFAVCNANILWQEPPKSNLDMVKDAFWDYVAKVTLTAEDSLKQIRQSELGQEVK